MVRAAPPSVEAPGHLVAQGQDVGEELERFGFIVGDASGQQPTAALGDRDAVVVGFSCVDAGPDRGHVVPPCGVVGLAAGRTRSPGIRRMRPVATVPTCAGEASAAPSRTRPTRLATARSKAPEAAGHRRSTRSPVASATRSSAASTASSGTGRGHPLRKAGGPFRSHRPRRRHQRVAVTYRSDDSSKTRTCRPQLGSTASQNGCIPSLAMIRSEASLPT